MKTMVMTAIQAMAMALMAEDQRPRDQKAVLPVMNSPVPRRRLRRFR
jgi:hypothetical protein